MSVFGRYPPTEDVRFFVRCSDFRRNVDLCRSNRACDGECEREMRGGGQKVKKNTHETLLPFFFSAYASYPPSSPCEPSLLSTDPDGLDGLCAPALPRPWPCPSLNMCTVSCADETQRSDETRLKLIEYMRASRVPLRNW